MHKLLLAFVLFAPASQSCLNSAKAQEPRATLGDHTNVVAAVCFTPDGTSVVSGSWDETVRVWDALSASQVQAFSEHTDWVETVAVTPDGEMLVAASQRAVHVWDLKALRHKAIYDSHRSHSISATALSPDGKLFACGVRDGSVLIWEVGGAEPQWRFKTGVAWTKCLAFSPDGKQLAAGDWVGDIRIWDLPGNRETQSLKGHPSSVVSALCFHPDGSELASGSYDASIKLWDVETGKPKDTLTGHKGLVLSLAYSGDGTQLASGERHGVIKLWTAGGKLLTTYNAHPDEKLGFSVTDLSFSPDGKTLASASYDTTVKLWNVPQQP